MALRGIRGATTVPRDDAGAILAETEALLRELMRANRLQTEEIGSALFTVTHDLTAAFPAAAARTLGWTLVPMLNFVEVPVPDALPFCIRVLLHVNTEMRQDEIAHVYLHDARRLRPDLCKPR